MGFLLDLNIVLMTGHPHLKPTEIKATSSRKIGIKHSCSSNYFIRSQDILSQVLFSIIPYPDLTANSSGPIDSFFQKDIYCLWKLLSPRLQETRTKPDLQRIQVQQIITSSNHLTLNFVIVAWALAAFESIMILSLLPMPLLGIMT